PRPLRSELVAGVGLLGHELPGFGAPLPQGEPLELAGTFQVLGGRLRHGVVGNAAARSGTAWSSAGATGRRVILFPHWSRFPKPWLRSRPACRRWSRSRRRRTLRSAPRARPA